MTDDNGRPDHIARPDDTPTDAAPGPAAEAPAPTPEPPVPAAEAAEARPESVTGAPPAPAAPGAIPGWSTAGTQSGLSGRSTGCIIVAAIVALLVLFLGPILALILVGSQVQSILSGTVTFGTSGVECDVDGISTSLPASGPIYMAAYFERDAQPGESVRIDVVTEGERIALSEEPITSTTRCLYLDIPSGEGAPGVYTFEFLSGDELLASGTVTLTP